MSKIKKVNDSASIVIIESLYFCSDWTYTKEHAINLNEIVGFILHWRGDSWHVEVKTKIKKNEYDYESYELSHCVMPKQIAELIANKNCKILSFKNYHNSDNFIQHLNKVLDWAKTIS